MIPLHDGETTRRLPSVNTILILANIAVFALEVKFGREGNATLARYAMVPAQLTNLHLAHPDRALEALATIFTSTFLHAGIFHLAGNMLYLFAFGTAVEQRMGASRYLLFYFAAAAGAALAMVAMGPDSRVPVIGASGAIAGVLGAYFVIYPRGRITTILPLVVFWPIVEIRAYFYLLMWFAFQLSAGIASGAHGPLIGGVAYWAHVGGFLFGIAAGPLFARVHSVSTRRARRVRSVDGVHR
jgi:membrane associated rhomboid family serine protease